MDTVLWIIQALLGSMMISLGLMKTFRPVEKLSNFNWTTHSSTGFIRFVGISELLIGAGLILPQLTGILPFLTSVAAASLCIVMVFAIVEHIQQHEMNQLWTNIVIIFLAVFVAVGRFVTWQ